MKDQELVNAIRRLKVETGSLACMGCGREHNCGVSGCAIMREAADRIANQSNHIAALQQEIEKLRGQVPRWISVTERLPETESWGASKVVLGIIQNESGYPPPNPCFCVYCRSYNKPKTRWCEVHLDSEHPDDFCSYGKRKDGGDG